MSIIINLIYQQLDIQVTRFQDVPALLCPMFPNIDRGACHQPIISKFTMFQEGCLITHLSTTKFLSLWGIVSKTMVIGLALFHALGYLRSVQCTWIHFQYGCRGRLFCLTCGNGRHAWREMSRMAEQHRLPAQNAALNPPSLKLLDIYLSVGKLG